MHRSKNVYFKNASTYADVQQCRLIATALDLDPDKDTEIVTFKNGKSKCMFTKSGCNARYGHLRSAKNFSDFWQKYNDFQDKRKELSQRYIAPTKAKLKVESAKIQDHVKWSEVVNLHTSYVDSVKALRNARAELQRIKGSKAKKITQTKHVKTLLEQANEHKTKLAAAVSKLPDPQLWATIQKLEKQLTDQKAKYNKELDKVTNPGEYGYWDSANKKCVHGMAMSKANCVVPGAFQKVLNKSKNRKWDAKATHMAESYLEGEPPTLDWDDDKQQCNITHEYCKYHGVSYSSGSGRPYCYKNIGQKICSWIAGSYNCQMGQKFFTDLFSGNVKQALKDLADIGLHLTISVECVMGLPEAAASATCRDMYKNIGVVVKSMGEQLQDAETPVVNKFFGYFGISGAADKLNEINERNRKFAIKIATTAATQGYSAVKMGGIIAGKSIADAAVKTGKGTVEAAENIAKSTKYIGSTVITGLDQGVIQAGEFTANIATDVGRTAYKTMKMKSAAKAAKRAVEETKKIAEAAAKKAKEVAEKTKEAAEKAKDIAGKGLHETKKVLSSGWHHATSWTHHFSDRRLKKMVKVLEKDFLGPDTGVNLYLYQWKPESGRHGYSIGFVAQEIQTMYPESVAKDPDTGYLKLSVDLARAREDPEYANYAMVVLFSNFFDGFINDSLSKIKKDTEIKVRKNYWKIPVIIITIFVVIIAIILLVKHFYLGV